MGGRVAEGARLESVYRIKNSIEGSNPSPSAKYHLPLLNDATEFFRSRLCAPRFTRLTQTRLQIQSPDLRLEAVFCVLLK